MIYITSKHGKEIKGNKKSEQLGYNYDSIII